MCTNNRAKFVPFSVDDEYPTFQLDSKGKEIKTSGQLNMLPQRQEQQLSDFDLDFITPDWADYNFFDDDVNDDNAVTEFYDEMFTPQDQQPVQPVQQVQQPVVQYVPQVQVQYAETATQTDESSIPSPQVRRINKIIENHGGQISVWKLCQMI